MHLKIDNDFYQELGNTWYLARDNPVALLRAESKVKSKWLIQKINEFFPQKESSPKIIDIGCGGGFVSNALAKEGFNVTGIDIHDNPLRIAHEFDKTKKVTYLKADAYHLPFEDKSFDVACMMDFLEHVEDIPGVIKECTRVLKKNGVLFFHTFNRNWLSYLLVIKGVEWCVKNTPQNMHVYPLFIKPKELQTILSKQGYSNFTTCGLAPKILSKEFLKLIFTRTVEDSFPFQLTNSRAIGYIGYSQLSRFEGKD